MLVSLLIGAGLSALHQWSVARIGASAYLLQALNVAVSFGVTTVVFASACRIGKYLIGVYIGRAGVTSGFDAAGSLVVTLVWVYYSAQIFLRGAEFTWVFAHRHGSKAGEAPEPGSSAIRRTG